MNSNEFKREMQLSGGTLRYDAKEAFAEFVLGLSDWKLFWTQTFAKPSRRGTYTRRGNAYAWSRWRRLVEFTRSEVGGACSTFTVVELHLSGVPHIHALLGRSRGSSRWPQGDDLVELAQKLEKHATETVGFSKVRVFNREGGAAGYCCKYCVKQDVEWKFEE